MNRPFHEVEALVNENMRLAYFMAKKHAWYMGEQDALSRAMEGLLLAAREWDPARELPFGTYAGVYIKWRFSYWRQQKYRKKRGGGLEHVHLETPLASGSQTVGDLIADEQAADPTAAVEIEDEPLDRLLGVLDKRSRLIIELRFGLTTGEPQTLGEIAKRFGISRERVRQVESNALQTMNEHRARGDHGTVRPIDSVRSKVNRRRQMATKQRLLKRSVLAVVQHVKAA